MSIKWQPGMKIMASMSIEPIKLDGDFGVAIHIEEGMPDLQKKVIEFFEEVSREANQRLIR